MNSPLLSRLPSVAQLLETPALRSLADRMSQYVIVQRARDILDDLRKELQQAVSEARAPDVLELAERIVRRVVAERRTNLEPVINATGLVLPEGLGDAPLSNVAIQALGDVAGNYCGHDFELPSGGDHDRAAHVEELLCELTGAPAALVVNSHSAATLLALTALAGEREVLVSRGQIFDHGDAYRLSEIFAASGARLREVGAANRTTLEDYERATTPQTAAVFYAQRGNVSLVARMEEPAVEDMAAFARKRKLPLIADSALGTLVDLAEFGCPDQPAWSSCLHAGADVLVVGGNLLLGGPQCGILLGRAELIAKLKQHPLAKALRLDKLRSAALAATLSLYRRPETRRELPLLQLLSAPLDNLRNRAERLAPQMAACRAIASAEPVVEQAPAWDTIVAAAGRRTWCIAIQPRSETPANLANRLRAGSPAVITRLEHDRLLLDMRSVFPRQDLLLVEAVERLDGPAAPPQLSESAE